MNIAYMLVNDVNVVGRFTKKVKGSTTSIYCRDGGRRKRILLIAHNRFILKRCSTMSEEEYMALRVELRTMGYEEVYVEGG